MEKKYKNFLNRKKNFPPFQKKGYSANFLLQVYENLLLPRMIEEKMFLLLRQGKISKWFSGIGQEAISVGATMALKENEFILTMHRNLPVFTARKVPLDRLFSQFLGKKNGFTQGRDRSFHFGSIPHHIVGMISHLGAQLAVATGIALGEILQKSSNVCLVFTGEGGTSEGDFHEALNVASVWNLPVIFIIENNQYALSTPSEEQYNCQNLIDRRHGYGMEGEILEGNHVLNIYESISKWAKELRNNPRPVLLECMTFRMRGHEESSGTKYIPPKYFEIWKHLDPLQNFEVFLKKEGILSDFLQEKMKKQCQKEIDCAWQKSWAEDKITPNLQKETKEIYKQTLPHPNFPLLHIPKKKQRLVDTILDTLTFALEKDPTIILMGQDIGEYGGVFKTTEGLIKKFGKERIRNTPLCESAIIGTALGLAIQGYKPIVEMQFADFATCAFNQIINNLAKIYYRWGQEAPVVIRMPVGGGVGAGPFHSTTNEAFFFHTPGLKIVYPAFPEDAKGLLLSSIEDPNPVLFFEHKALYRSVKGSVPQSNYRIPIGEGKLLLSGNDLTIVSYGLGIHWALEELKKHPQISADLIDLRTLLPWDQRMVSQSLQKTGKILILHEDTLSGGIGGEISAYLGEYFFEYLDAPIVRVASLDTMVPYSKPLEDQFLGKMRFQEKLLKLWKY